jgi:hypothetical protein
MQQPCSYPHRSSGRGILSIGAETVARPAVRGVPSIGKACIHASLEKDLCLQRKPVRPVPDHRHGGIKRNSGYRSGYQGWLLRAITRNNKRIAAICC